MGEYRLKFAKKFAPELDKLFGKDGSKLANMTYGVSARSAARYTLYYM